MNNWKNTLYGFLMTTLVFTGTVHGTNLTQAVLKKTTSLIGDPNKNSAFTTVRRTQSMSPTPSSPGLTIRSASPSTPTSSAMVTGNTTSSPFRTIDQMMGGLALQSAPSSRGRSLLKKTAPASSSSQMAISPKKTRDKRLRDESSPSFVDSPITALHEPRTDVPPQINKRRRFKPMPSLSSPPEFLLGPPALPHSPMTVTQLDSMHPQLTVTPLDSMHPPQWLGHDIPWLPELTFAPRK